MSPTRTVEGSATAVAAALTLLTTFGGSACIDFLRPADSESTPTQTGVVLERVIPQQGGFSNLQRPVADSALIYADVIGGGPIVAYDYRTGAQVWSYDRPPNAPSSLVRHGDALLFAGSEVVALNARTGAERWRVPVPIDGPLGNGGGLGVTAAAGNSFYVGSDRWLFAFDVATGAEQWRREVGVGWEFPGLVRGVDVAGDTLYASIHRFHTANGFLATAHIVALDRHTGVELWRHVEGDSLSWHVVLLEARVVQDLVVAADHIANTYFALDRWTGALRWRVPSTTVGFFGPWEPPTVSGDTLYGASADRLITAMDLQTGAVLWRAQTGSSATATMPCGNRLLVHDGGGYVLHRASGRILGRQVHAKGDEDAILVSRFAAFGERVFVLGNRAIYVFRCSDG